MRKSQLAAYSLGHFWVDFCCALLMFSRMKDAPQLALCVLIYNFCAFALQMPIGLIADKLNRNSCVAALGCCLVALGWGFAKVPLLACTLAGVGNGCFHVGGGIDALNVCERKSAALGIFVSPGALGIFLGGQSAAAALPGGLVALVLLAFGALFMLLDLRLRGGLTSGNAPVALDAKGKLWPLACCFLVVALRSWVGLALSFPWKAGAWAVLATCAVVLGKAAGGFLGDAIGMRRASAISLGLAALLFAFGNLPLAGVLALFLFNMTMPITLWASAKLLPGGKGFAFGALTFALFLGFLPVYLGWSAPLSTAATGILGALASLAVLLMGLVKGGL